MSMTLEQVRDWHRELSSVRKKHPVFAAQAKKHADMADAIDAHLTQPRAVPKEFIEDIQRAERLALKSKKLNRERMMGLAVVKHLSHLFTAAPSPGESE